MDRNTRSTLEAIGDVLNGLDHLRETIMGDVVPAEALRHFRSSRREALLGLRSVLDRSIEQLAERPSPDSRASTGKKSSRSVPISDE
ncbi:hypothetical protein [Paenibacillus arenilitoris]|uniref:Uncharacterized protein n=1 Tax=Paenibacillus arenilitoris TaxID=2772299 RepID=A0A927CR07_9BACL|nr:hypothetical protein [Paenibacillus arenilitoris]MBD2871920.1 hypothetical protein [Paenibacillus arenilitoris]